MYFDYLEMSDAIGRDVRSPKYLCPKNLKKAHDEVMKLKQKLDEKIDFENHSENHIPERCYELILSKNYNEQKILYSILLELERYKNE